jgi:hypothetical protein
VQQRKASQEGQAVKVLVACERSGVVRRAFRSKGHIAWSCDLSAAEDRVEHIRGDVREFLNQPWDLLIAHPECRYLSVSGMHWTTRGLRDPKLTDDAIAFAELLWAADIPRICIENPVGVLTTRSTLGKWTQKIQPYEFGEDASKQTCLWLKNLPPLTPTKFIAPRMVDGKPRWSNQTDSGQNKLGPSEHRSSDRARTYEGIAAAMAEQWGQL